MSTMIQTQSASRGNNGATTGALGGAAQGAMTGAVVGGPVGAIVGGAIGFVGGLIGGKKVDKAKQYQKIAAKWKQVGDERQAGIVLRDQVRDFRMKRSMALANVANEEGGTRSSAPMGAAGSMSSQYAFNRNYAFGQIYIGRQVSRYLQKAGKELNAANTIFSSMDAASSLISTGYGMYKSYKANNPGGHKMSSEDAWTGYNDSQG